MERALQSLLTKDIKKKLDLGEKPKSESRCPQEKKGQVTYIDRVHCYIPVIPTCGKLRQEDYGFGDSLAYIASLSPKAICTLIKIK